MMMAFISVNVEWAIIRDAPVQVGSDFVGFTGGNGMTLGAPCLEETSTLGSVTYNPALRQYPAYFISPWSEHTRSKRHCR